MTEVVEWDGKPRYMWCWDKDKDKKCKRYVLCILNKEEMLETGTEYPVRIICGSYFLHCAEIEEEPKKETRLTNYELSQLLKCLGVEYKPLGYEHIDNSYVYSLNNQNLSAPTGSIRYKQGEWMSATRETIHNWWKDETPAAELDRFISVMGWSEDKK